MANSETKRSIGIRVDDVDQLFDALDPFPFPQRDLARSTEDHVLRSALELPRGEPIEIVVHLPDPETANHAGVRLGEAFSAFFADREESIGLGLRELFRVGRWSLLIGLSVLAACLLVGQLLESLAWTGLFGRFSREGLAVLGWVALWRPLEIFLYEWWPLADRQRLYRRLSKATVRIARQSESRKT